MELGRAGRFGCVGLLGAALNSGVLWLLTEQVGLYYLISSAVAIETAIVSNFLLNHYWTFARAQRPPAPLGELLRRLARFNLVSLGGMALTLSALFVLTQAGGLPYLIANVFAIGCGALWNFGFSRLWVWRAALV
ncbi:MAG: GtrA family protein [Chloroflexota bacterium]